jgi:hypothetical protein
LLAVVGIYPNDCIFSVVVVIVAAVAVEIEDTWNWKWNLQTLKWAKLKILIAVQGGLQRECK